MLRNRIPSNLPTHLGWVSDVETVHATTNIAPEPDTEAMYRWTEDVTTVLNRKRSSEERSSGRHSNKHAERKVPPKLDLSRLFTRRKSSKPLTVNLSGNSTQNDTNISNSPPYSAKSDYQSPQQHTPQQQTPHSGTQWNFRLKKAKSRDSTPAVTPRINAVGHTQMDMDSPKINVRRPPPGIQHWFDGYAEEGSPLLENDTPSSPESPMHIKSKRARTRDTFLSMSSQIDTAKSDPAQPHSQEESLKGLGLSGIPKHRVQRSKSDFAEQVPALLVEPPRPKSQRSRSSTAALQQSIRRRRQLSARQDCLPQSITKGQSILILSGNDDSEGDQSGDERSDQVTGTVSPSAYPDPSTHETALANVMLPTSPTGIRRSRETDRKPSLQVPDNVTSITSTDIDDSSQATSMDNHSPRTTLLSESRPISYADDFPDSRPISSVDFPEPWLASPTMSVISPPMASLIPSTIYPPSPGSEISASTHRNPSIRRQGPTHHLMAVTAEEAQLLENIRRTRAQLAAQSHTHRLADGSSSRPATASTRESRDRSRSAGAESADTTRQIVTISEPPLSEPKSSPKPSLLSPPFSPLASPPLSIRPTSNTVTQVWEDVQAWRKHEEGTPNLDTLFGGALSSPGPLRPRASTSYSRTAPPIKYLSHFSPDTDSTTQIMSPRSAGPGDGRPGLKKYSWSDGFAVPKVGSSASEGWRRSRSMGECSPRLDVAEDVLAAWNDLGGWKRKSFMSGMSVVSE